MKMNNKCTASADIDEYGYRGFIDLSPDPQLMATKAELIEENRMLREDLDGLIHIIYRANLNRKIEEKEGHTTNHFGDEMTWEAPTGDYLGIPTIHRVAKEIARKNGIYPYNMEVA